jgi:UDP-3-O-[3-hydroxymyristoyl] glucosamine N-acyltransferase
MSLHRLSEFEGLAGLKVVRDSAFAVTGKLSTLLDGVCVPLRSEKYLGEVNGNDRVAAVITTPALSEGVDPRLGLAIAADPDAAHSEVHAQCAKLRDSELRAIPNRIDSSADIDPGAHIASYGVEIGPRCYIGPGAVVRPGAVIEHDSIIHSGTSIGGPGFNTGFIGGRRRIVPQLGGVRVGPFVELLSNCCVARALFGGNTVIGEETVTDSLVYIAHDVQIGRGVQICALVNVLGRTVVGDDAYLGPSAVIRNGLEIGAGAKVSMGAVVTENVGPGSTVTGNFAIGHDRFLAHLRSIRKEDP